MSQESVNPLKLTRKELLEQLSINRNVCIPKDIKERIDQKVISERDLEDVGIPKDIIPHISTYKVPILEFGEEENLDNIKEKGLLEVYFWGVRSSGKTCALAAILHSIQNKGIKNVGFESAKNSYNDAYLRSIKDEIIKSNGIAYFPSRTPDNKIKYMTFNLLKYVENQREKFWSKEYVKVQEIFKRRIAFIDLSGELIQNIVDNDINKEKINEETIKTIKTLKKLLNNSNNRKIHFFFIDYERDEDTLNQTSYLERLISIFKKEKYFDKTEFIYIVITKSDMFRRNGNDIPKNQRRNFAKELFDNNNLKLNIIDVCKSGKGINMENRKVVLDDKILDFSMGEVYFQRICKFNPDSAKEIINILLHRINATDELYG
jgi:hypothetical protein